MDMIENYSNFQSDFVLAAYNELKIRNVEFDFVKFEKVIERIHTQNKEVLQKTKERLYLVKNIHPNIKIAVGFVIPIIIQNAPNKLCRFECISALTNINIKMAYSAFQYTFGIIAAIGFRFIQIFLNTSGLKLTIGELSINFPDIFNLLILAIAAYLIRNG